ncbi:MAG: LuxR C-terminal-related transcriptional regulator [Gemmatimonadota bacterium]
MTRKTLKPSPLSGGARLLLRFGADPISAASSAAAVERLFVKLQQRFNPLVGRDGYRALLQEAHRITVETHPVLERYPVASQGNPFFGRLSARIGEEDPGEVWEGLAALTGEFMRLARGMSPQGEVTHRRCWKSIGDADGGESGMNGKRTVNRARKRTGLAVALPTPPATQEDSHRKENPQITGPWRVLVMDRDRSTCEALAHSLDQARDFRVVEQVITADEVQRKLRTGEVDFVVASVHLPFEEILEVCRWLRKEHGDQGPQIVLTGLPDDPAVMLRFLEAGATAFTMEEFSVQGLRLALRLLARGEVVFPLRLQHLMSLRLSALAELARDRGLNPDTLSSLTERETGVLNLLDQGLTNRQISQKLFISEGTVKSHVHQIIRKLKVRDRKEAVRVLHLHRSTPTDSTVRTNGSGG